MIVFGLMADSPSNGFDLASFRTKVAPLVWRPELLMRIILSPSWSLASVSKFCFGLMMPMAEPAKTTDFGLMTLVKVWVSPPFQMALASLAASENPWISFFQ